MYKFGVVFLCFLSISVSVKNDEYIGYRVYNIKLQNEKQQNDMIVLKSDIIDFWKHPNWKYKTVGKVMVPPSQFNWFEDTLEKIGLERDVVIDDVFQYLADKDSFPDNGNLTEFDYNGYYRYDVILDHLYNLEASYTNTSIDFEVIQYGETEENRPLVYVKVTSNEDEIKNTDKPAVLIEAAINPRDWATVPAAINVIREILEEHNRSLLNVIWIIVPVLNPDGYEYTHTNLRLWTKSRSLKSYLSFICPGVNIDRNFDVDWLNSESSSSPCSHLYAGVQPLSEPETQLINHILQTHKPTMHISLQNKGKAITFPWNFEKAASGLFRRHFLLGLEMKYDDYVLDSGAIAFGDRVSGTSMDFARESGVVYTYTVGIEGDDDEGVLVPVEDIGRVVDDVWRIVKTAVSGIGMN